MSEVRMQEVPDYKPGTFCWVELGTSDGAAAKDFYTQLFGWEYVDFPMGRMTFTQCSSSTVKMSPRFTS